MENKSHALAAGSFLVLLMALLLAMAVWLMRDTSAQRVFELVGEHSVSGLQLQAGVRYKGVAVGRVTAIGLDPQAAGHVLVRILVNEQVPITTATVASLGYQGVTGLAFIQLEDVGATATALLSPAGQPARIPLQPGLLARWTEQGDQLLNQLRQASQRTNALLADDHQKNLMQAIDNLGRAAASLQRLTEHVDQVLAGSPGEARLDVPRLASQADASFKAMQTTAERLSASAETVRNSAAEFKKVSVRMHEPGGTLERVARSTDALNNASLALSGTLLPRLYRAADDSARTVRQLGHVADALADNPQSLLFGKGSAAPGPGEPGFIVPSAP